MGRGRSGSTILDILLGNSSQIQSVGELAFALSRAETERCSCGATVPNCVFWRQVRQLVERDNIQWAEACSLLDRGMAGLLRVWYTAPTDRRMLRRAHVVKALAKAVSTMTGKPHLLDSGKGPAHGLLLLRHVPDARIIHLVRDPRTMLQSFLWRVQSRSHLNANQLAAARIMSPLFLAWIALDWTVANWICDLMSRAYPKQVLRVRFEDLCRQPDLVLQRIGAAFGLDKSDLERVGQLAVNREPLHVGHTISGNHVRHADVVRFDPGGGKKELPVPRWLRFVITVLCGPLMSRYEYKP